MRLKLNRTNHEMYQHEKGPQFHITNILFIKFSFAMIPPSSVLWFLIGQILKRHTHKTLT